MCVCFQRSSEKASRTVAEKNMLAASKALDELRAEYATTSMDYDYSRIALETERDLRFSIEKDLREAIAAAEAATQQYTLLNKYEVTMINF